AELPLIVGFRIGNPKKVNLNLQFGVVGGLNIGALVKDRYFITDVKYKNKIKDDYNINPFRLDAIVKLKITNFIGVFGRYSLTTVFEKGKTQEVYPLSIGITLMGI